MLALDQHVAIGSYFGVQHSVLSEAPHEERGAAVDEALREPLVQRVRQTVLYPTRLALPMLGVGEPVAAIGDEAPGAHLRDPLRQRIDIAIGAIDFRQTPGKPVVRNAPAPHDEEKDGAREFRMGGRRNLAIVGNLADFPEPRDIGRRRRLPAHVLVVRENVQHHLVFRDRRARQTLLTGQPVERDAERRDR